MEYQKNCSSCGVAIPATVSYCPACGVQLRDKRWAGETGTRLTGLRWAMKAVRYVLSFGLSFLVGFYTAFVLTMFWDWFVTPAFHVEEIGYWNMYGLVLIIRLLTPSNNGFLVEKWERAMQMLEACIPEEKRGDVMSAIDKGKLSMNAQLLIANGMGLMGSTISLLIGWVVHTALM